MKLSDDSMLGLVLNHQKEARELPFEGEIKNTESSEVEKNC